MTSPFARRFESVGIPAGWRHNSEEVVYSRDAVSESMRAIAEDPAQQIDNFRDGRSLSLRRREWLVQRGELSAFGHPEKGDRITRLIQGRTEVWEVMREQNDREWDWEGAGSSVYRIRTKLIEDGFK